MAARSIGSGTISFGLVSIPVRFYVATHSEAVSFNMLHQPCGSRIRQQLWCPKCERPVERGEIVKGFEFARDQYVTFSEEELRGLEAETNRAIDIHEFVPLATVDPIYFESAHYLGPDKGAEKAYHLLAAAMRDTGKGAVAQWASRGKEHMVLIRPRGEGLVLHSLYYANEVRSMDEIQPAAEPKVREGEVELARRLIEQLTSEAFRPEQYRDAYRERVQAAVDRKVAGEEVTVAAAAQPRAQVIDLMEALKESLARKGAAAGARGAARAGTEQQQGGKRRPSAAARRTGAGRVQPRARKG